MLAPIPDGLADKNCGPVLLVQALEARRQVHDAAVRPVFPTVRGTDISHHGIAEINAKSGQERRQPFGFEL